MDEKVGLKISLTMEGHCIMNDKYLCTPQYTEFVVYLFAQKLRLIGHGDNHCT